MHTTATPQQQSWARAVCASEGLGPLLSLRPVPGGYLHQMLRLDTASGSYALKLLNPLILRRPGALQNFEEAERLERLLEKAGLPIVPPWNGRDKNAVPARARRSTSSPGCRVQPFPPPRSQRPTAKSWAAS